MREAIPLVCVGMHTHMHVCPPCTPMSMYSPTFTQKKKSENKTNSEWIRVQCGTPGEPEPHSLLCQLGLIVSLHCHPPLSEDWATLPILTAQVA